MAALGRNHHHRHNCPQTLLRELRLRSTILLTLSPSEIVAAASYSIEVKDSFPLV